MKRLLTGDRPTGKLHLGHFVGSLENRVKLQADYDTYIMVADVQGLTDHFATPEKIRRNVHEVVLDNLAVGVDPNKVTYFIQSQIPEIAELTIFFMNLVSVSRLQRNPTVKTEIQQKGFGNSIPVGFFCYPISQAADILTFKADIVPVGEDQNPMLEQTREIADKFNQLYSPIFPRPETIVGQVSRLVGVDGNSKMGKSLHNAISLSDPPEIVEKMILGMYTDPNRIHATDPGKTEDNPLFIYLNAFAPPEEKAQVADYTIRYREGRVGDREVKQYLTRIVNNLLEPIRTRRQEYEQHPQFIHDLLVKGTKKAREVATQTLKEVRLAMQIDY